MDEHKVELGYTNADDGVWLTCSCGWWFHLGFFESPESAMSATLEHYKNPDVRGNEP